VVFYLDLVFGHLNGQVHLNSKLRWNLNQQPGDITEQTWPAFLCTRWGNPHWLWAPERPRAPEVTVGSAGRWTNNRGDNCKPALLRIHESPNHEIGNSLDPEQSGRERCRDTQSQYATCHAGILVCISTTSAPSTGTIVSPDLLVHSSPKRCFSGYLTQMWQ